MNWDGTLFENLRTPEDIDRETLIYKIVLECAELEVIYPVPAIMKQAITLWGNSRYHAWEKMADALYKNYDPYYNYIREEDTNEAINESSSRKDTGESQNYTSAFNIDEMANTGSTDTKMNRSGEFDHNRDTTSTIKGNIGMASMQTHLNEELEVRKRDLYQIIVNEFKKEFCLLVY